ncbi:cory-CC-star protein [Streptomonospora algeriensis]|uniref:Cory-CC-star protein n=1 Tax=Streptomonospora algeriensis TaxID=995084 RepID=A0ABW3BJV9_9ACTN
MTGRWERLRSAWRRIEGFHEEWFASRWRHVLRREARTQQDTLRAMLLLQTLGVEDPAAYETLDLIPYMVSDLHEWHQRMGRETFGDAGVCC